MTTTEQTQEVAEGSGLHTMHEWPGWTPTQAPWADREPEEAFLRRLRFRHVEFTLGDAEVIPSVAARVFTREQRSDQQDFPFPYLVRVDLGERVETIVCRDFPALLSLLKDLAPVIALDFQTRAVIEEGEHRLHLVERKVDPHYRFCLQADR
jgi:hypothetical protein